MSVVAVPEYLRRSVGELTAAGRLPPGPYPFATIHAESEGFVGRGGARSWYAVWGNQGPWIAFAPIFQITHQQMLKMTVPYLSRHFRVVTMDCLGNGRSDRPLDPAAYDFDDYYGDFIAALDAAGADRAAVVGISATAMTALRLAAELPARVSHLVLQGGFAHLPAHTDPRVRELLQAENDLMRDDYREFLLQFFTRCYSEPHSTKAFEDAVNYGWATTNEVLGLGREGWHRADTRDLAARVRCPTLIIHGDDDRRVPFPFGKAIHDLVPQSRLLTIGGGGHLTAARDPVIFNHAVREFVGGVPQTSTWMRGMSRRRKALFVSSPIGLGHVQRDLAIAREIRKLHPDLEIDWFTVDPAARYLVQEGERLHPLTARLANESQHFEHVAGEHDLSAFFALRTMDEIMINNFMVFSDLLEQEHYDLVIGDEAWDVDYYYHENPERKRQPFIFLTDFVGCLPMTRDEREAHLCADRNADDIEHVARFPYLRDAAIFVGNSEDVTDAPFGPGLPRIRDWTDRNFSYSGYTLPFDPAEYADTERLRAKYGYRKDEKIAIAAVGGTAVGGPLLAKIARAFPRMKRELPELRLILVTGPRLAANALPEIDGLEIRPYVHKLFEHLACADLALVQGGLSTCMELVATRRPFLSFPLARHFEQNIHVRRRLANYGADNAVDYHGLSPETLADRALTAMHSPVRYARVETDGAARAARRIADVLENRHWIQR